MQPLVTVNILSYNRKDDLRHTLQKVFEQDYKNIEVVVVDNNSSDNSAEMVKTEFPTVRLLELQNNIGIAGWNEGAKIATGEYLLFLDDDSYPVSLTIAAVMQNRETERTIYALDIRILDGTAYAPYLHDEEPLRTFIGCGVMMSKIYFEQLGGYNASLFLYCHEIEFCLRAYQHGFNVRFVPDAIVVHVSSPVNRTNGSSYQTDKRRAYYFQRNIIFILLYYFPLRSIFGRVMRFILGHWLFALCHRKGWITMKGTVAGMGLVFQQRHSRKVLNREVCQLFGNGKYFASFFGDGIFAFHRPPWLSIHIIKNSFLNYSK